MEDPILRGQPETPTLSIRRSTLRGDLRVLSPPNSNLRCTLPPKHTWDTHFEATDMSVWGKITGDPKELSLL